MRLVPEEIADSEIILNDSKIFFWDNLRLLKEQLIRKFV